MVLWGWGECFALELGLVYVCVVVRGVCLAERQSVGC